MWMGIPWFAKEIDKKDFIPHLNSLNVALLFFGDVEMPWLVVFGMEFFVSFPNLMILLLQVQNDKMFPHTEVPKPFFTLDNFF